MGYVKDVTHDRLGLDFDTIFRHLAPAAHAPIGIEELRTVFFGGYMDTAAEEPGARAYDEVRVRTPPPPRHASVSPACCAVSLLRYALARWRCGGLDPCGRTPTETQRCVSRAPARHTSA